MLNFTSNAVLDACDTIDGVKDRLIEDPLRCNFDVETLACHGKSSLVMSAENGSVSCLTDSQLSALRSIYNGPVRSDNGSQLYPGFSLGSEIELLLQEGTLADAFSIPILQNLVYGNLTYNSNDFNWASNVADVDLRAGRLIDEVSPDLSAFRVHGGKMIITQGWADPYNAALWPIEHLKQVQEVLHGDVKDFVNLFMVRRSGILRASFQTKEEDFMLTNVMIGSWRRPLRCR
jgi:feruloyl esterase